MVLSDAEYDALAALYNNFTIAFLTLAPSIQDAFWARLYNKT